MAIVEIEQVRYRYPTVDTWALNDISLRIEPGEFVILAGASGSGKSTLLRLLNGLIPHFYEGEYSGHTRIAGTDTRACPVHAWLPQVALVFQNPKAQLFTSSVEHELAFGLERLGLPIEVIRARISWAAEAAGIAPLLGRAPHTLSGGEQQRVSVAAALALRPHVLALDEPYTHLDPATAEELRAVLRTANGEGTTIIVAEHRLTEMLADASRLLIMSAGQVVLDEVPRRALRRDLAQFHVNIPILVREARVQGLTDIPLTVEEATSIGMHAPVSVADAAPAAQEISESVVEADSMGYDIEGRIILRSMNLAIRRGETVALIGRNGSGKTTLLKHLNALRRPTHGRLVVLGNDTRRAKVATLAARVGFVFQNPNDQLFKLSVREEIEIGARATRRYDERLLESLYDVFDLHQLLNRSPFRLSEGQKKRVALAAALAARPEILALDEPTVGQDAASRDALISWLGDYKQTVIVATHDLEFAHDVSARWVAMADGEVVADGAPTEVMSDANAMTVAGLRPTPLFALAVRLNYESARLLS